ncbi:MAG: class I SAM-dependent methyltransferase [Armatimonadetes bacterium]|nr:class I SAM-dependent methyltransferase [Armatimonadota bacterium]
MSFPDHFSGDSTGYRDSRPTYPAALFEWLAGTVNGRERAWDCGCGSGQASLPLADYFDEVIATDASSAQIDASPKRSNVAFRVADAGASGIPSASVNIVAAAQAAHWFDHAAFHAEVARVLRPGGLLAVWSYDLHEVSEEFDAVVRRFYSEIVGPYWPMRRLHVEQGYRELPFPYDLIETPSFAMSHSWTFAQVYAYIGTWSSSQSYMNALGRDPRALIEEELLAAWGDAKDEREVTWPVTVLAGYEGTASGS